jgi:hypothetical protein
VVTSPEFLSTLSTQLPGSGPYKTIKRADDRRPRGHAATQRAAIMQDTRSMPCRVAHTHKKCKEKTQWEKEGRVHLRPLSKTKINGRTAVLDTRKGRRFSLRPLTPGRLAPGTRARLSVGRLTAEQTAPRDFSTAPKSAYGMTLWTRSHDPAIAEFARRAGGSEESAVLHPLLRHGGSAAYTM